MSLPRNIFASVTSQVYVALIGILTVPMYVKYMGAEAYGLVGFFAVLQAWFNLLDIGLSPTIARQSARHNGGAMDALSYRRLVRALEFIFLTIASVGTAVLLASSSFIAYDWLKASQLPQAEVLSAVQLMAPIIGLRWLAGLYRGAISGLERVVWLGGFNAAIATLRFGGAIPLLILVGSTPTEFFVYQLGVAIIEFAFLMAYAYRLFPSIPAGTRLPWSWAPLKPMLNFSLMIAFTSTAGILLVQTDKLLLSKILPLADYGYFTLAVLVASGVIMLTGPVSTALLPRLVRLESQGHHAELIRVYQRTTQLVSVAAGAAAVTIAICADSILMALTGDEELTKQAASILALYALGNGIFAVSAFPYYLQFAKGDLKLHLIGNAVFVMLLVPLMYWATNQYGAVGAGYVWLGMNLLSFVAWLPFVHRKFAPGINVAWYGRDVGIIVMTISIAGVCGNLLLPHAQSTATRIAEAAAYVLTLSILGALASSDLRARLVSLLSSRSERST